MDTSGPLTLKVPGYPNVMVADFADASQIYCERREESGLGASEYPEGAVYVADRKIARISYNGRVWNAGPWNEGDVPLYDNRV